MTNRSAIANLSARSASLMHALALCLTSPPLSPLRDAWRHIVMGSVRTTPLPWLTVSLLVLGLAGGLLAFLAYPAYAQDGDAPLTARFLADTGPSNQGGRRPGVHHPH